MKIYTKTGDDGTTGLFGAGRVPKNHPRVALNGDVDELSSYVGLVRSLRDQSPALGQLDGILARIQNRLFTIGALITTPPQSVNFAKIPKLTESDTAFLEAAIDRLTADLPELTQFIPPGGGRAASFLHVCRTVARRAERTLAAAHAANISLDPLIAQYLNRLSDLLFTMARWVNMREGISETSWEK
ncbi:MAG: cob(I)yrinic acid a,c-diamide adenosyltransferase [Patescibacteria group bacterium]|nr:cob(I)yrinic acid a,c-diamide adenosyltransferase [Patescibacteria group bacterium]